MLRWSLADSAGYFWQPAEFEDVANPGFENPKHLQNPEHLPLNEPSMSYADNGCASGGDRIRGGFTDYYHFT